MFNVNKYLYLRFIYPDHGRQRIAECRPSITKRRPKDAEPHEATVPITWYAVKPEIFDRNNEAANGVAALSEIGLVCD